MFLGLGSALVALALILGFVLVLAPRFGQPTTPGTLASAHVLPSGWHLYADPDGYFTIGLPAGWQVMRDTGTGQEGDATSSATVRSVTTTLLPPGAAKSGTKPDVAAVGLKVSLTYFVYTNLGGNYKQVALCSAYHGANTQLDGSPARQLDAEHGWLVATSAATYQVNYSLPGDLPPTLIRTLPTPVPQATRTSAENQALAIIHTIRLTPATAPKC